MNIQYPVYVYRVNAIQKHTKLKADKPRESDVKQVKRN